MKKRKTTKSAPPRKKKRPAATRKTVVNIGARKKRRSSVGSTAVGKRRKKSKKRSHGFLGSTNNLIPNQDNLKKIFKMAVGVAGGVVASNLVIKPLERKILEKWPGIEKFLGVGEILIGGMMALKAKSHIVQGAGIGILASGVHNTITKFEIFKQIPGIHGVDEYTTVQIPINGLSGAGMAGLLKDGRQEIYTNQVSGFNNTNQVSGFNNTFQVSGDIDEILDFPTAKGSI